MSVTMKDVAEYAGLSIGTVSNYITGRKQVSEQKREMIEQAIDVLGYQVNIAARNLRTNSFRTIGVLIPSFHNVYLLRIISIFEELMQRNGYSILVLSYQQTPQKERERLAYLVQRVDGIIYTPSCLDQEGLRYLELIQEDTPVVVFDETMEGLGCDQVLVNGEEVARKAVNVLLDKGHQQIGMLAGPKRAYTSGQRIRGYRKAFDQKHLPVQEDLIVFGDYAKSTGEKMCQVLLERHENMTALFVAGYRMMLGAMSVLYRQNLQDRIEVIGYDASDLEYILSPRVGYVYQPYDEVARCVADLILKRVEKNMVGYPETVYLDADIRNTE